METGKNSFNTSCVGLTKKEELNLSSTLLVESEFDKLSYAIIDKKANHCVGLCTIPIDSSLGRMDRRSHIKSILSEDEVLNFPFVNRMVLVANRECVFIPEEIFDEASMDYYINASYGDNFTGKCFSIKLPELKNYIVYKVPEWLIYEFSEHLSGAPIKHSSAYLVESIYRLSNKTKEVVIHAHFKRSFFELILFKEGKMLFYNSFSYQTSEDIAYFVMYALKQWEVEGKRISVSGLLNEDSDELYWLRKYFEELCIFPQNELMPYPASLENPSSYLNLLNPTLCE